jgi:Ca2+-binding RTX toxin-like protein
VAAFAAALLMAASTQATVSAEFTLDKPNPCVAGSCRVVLSFDTSALQAPVRLEIVWDVATKRGASADVTFDCRPQAPCTARSPVFRRGGRTAVALRVTDSADGTADVGAQALLVTAGRGGKVPVGPGGSSGAGLCAPRQANVNCAPGNGRQTSGGGDKVPHTGWPRVTGILWKVLDSTGRNKVGGPDNDELLGHHGSDRLSGGAGHDIIWGDWDPEHNNTHQRDVLSGGSGNDWIYPSHGPTVVKAGPGRDYVWAYYGRGSIDCGPGNDTARVKLNGPWKLHNCEHVLHFCAFGADGHGGCLKPGEKRQGRARSTPPRHAASATNQGSTGQVREHPAPRARRKES